VSAGPGAGVADRFAALLADPAGCLIGCDYDGTLAPIVDDPAAAFPATGAVEALVRLASRVARVAVVTGRPAVEAVTLGGLDRVPGLVVFGLYGAQRWAAGVLVAPEPAPGLAGAGRDLMALLAHADSGLRLEAKGGSLAVHSRGASDPRGALESVRADLTAIAARHGLRVAPGRLVLELLPDGARHADKGAALSELVALTGARSLLYLGDDLGDLAAFEVCARLRAAGCPAWSVAAANTEAPQVAAAADVVVDGPGGVVELLSELAQLLG
jgi:trehalose 6-phosphate phosphatase